MKKHLMLRLLPLLCLTAQLNAADAEKKLNPSYKARTKKEAIQDYNTSNPSLATLSPVTVTANSTIQDELLSPKSVSIYTKEDIRKSGVTSLMDFFKYYTEIQTEPSFGNVLNPQLSLRGFGNGDGYQNINIIVDGVTLNQIDQVPQQLGSVPVNSIEKIEVVKSDGAVVYGDNAAAGTIIIRTNNSFDRKQLYGNLRTSFGTYDTTLTHLNLGSVTDYKGLKILADGNFSYLDSNGKKAVLEDGTQDTIENINGRAALGFQKDNLEVLTSFIKDDANVVYMGAMDLAEFYTNPNISVTRGSRNIVHKEDWMTTLRYKFNERFNLMYSYANKSRDSKFPAFGSIRSYEGEDHRLTLQTHQDKFAVLAGLDYNFNEREDNFVQTRTSKENVAGFLSADFFVDDQLTVNAGFRQAFIKYDNFNSATNSRLVSSVNPSSYNISANYAFEKNDAIFANYIHAFQSPDIDRFFFANFLANPVTTSFNFDINTMTMDTYSLGYKHMDDDLKVKAEFYYSDLNNEIFFKQTGPFNGINTNFDNSEKYGIDLSLFKNFGWLHGSINYLYTETRARLGTGYFEISNQPKHIVLATIGKEFTSPAAAFALPYGKLNAQIPIRRLCPG